MTAIFTESEYEIELSAVQGPAGAGLSAIANNTLLGNTSGSTATPVARTAQQMGLLSATEVQTYTTEQQEVARDNIAAQLASANLSRLDGTVEQQRDAIDIGWVRRDNDLSVTSVTRTGPMPSGVSRNLVIIGHLAVNGENGAITSLTDSFFMGTQSGRLARFGNGNVALGNLTLASIETTNHNTVGGDAAGRFLKDGSSGNSIWGYVSATELEFGSSNVIIGTYSGCYSKRGNSNVLIGPYAGAHFEGALSYNGDDNILIGETVGLLNEGNHNFGAGFEALYNNKGDENIGLGRESGKSLSQTVLSTDLAISVVTSQTQFTLVGGPGTDQSNLRVVVKDASDSNRPYVGRGSYLSGTGVLTLTSALPITVTTSDLVTLASIPIGNIQIGTRAGTSTGVQKVDAKNSICIGNDTYNTADNQIVIGNDSTHTSTKIAGNIDCRGFDFTADRLGGTLATNGAIARLGGFLYITMDTGGFQVNRNDNGIGFFTVFPDGKTHFVPPASATPTHPTQLCFEASDTTFTIKRRDSGGTVRSVSLTLA